MMPPPGALAAVASAGPRTRAAVAGTAKLRRRPATAEANLPAGHQETIRGTNRPSS